MAMTSALPLVTIAITVSFWCRGRSLSLRVTVLMPASVLCHAARLAHMQSRHKGDRKHAARHRATMVIPDAHSDDFTGIDRGPFIGNPSNERSEPTSACLLIAGGACEPGSHYRVERTRANIENPGGDLRHHSGRNPQVRSY